MNPNFKDGRPNGTVDHVTPATGSGHNTKRVFPAQASYPGPGENFAEDGAKGTGRVMPNPARMDGSEIDQHGCFGRIAPTPLIPVNRP